MPKMDNRPLLSALLSQTLVAFTIEFDNEFEHRVPHRTTDHGSTAEARSVPWLVSMAMWSKFMRFVPDGGIPVRELQHKARFGDKEMRMWLTRMSKWWGYVAVQRRAAHSRLRQSASDVTICPTPGGQKALDTWRPLTGIIEKRWEERFGKTIVNQLRSSLQTVAGKLDNNVPDSLPILGYDLLSKIPDLPQEKSTFDENNSCTAALPALLSKVLLAFAAEYERGTGLSLAVSANGLRVLNDEGVRVRDIPRLSGVSKEAVALVLNRLEKRSYVLVRSESHDSRWKVAALTSTGRLAQQTYYQAAGEIEKRWQIDHGRNAMATLRQSLEELADTSDNQPSRLFQGLDEYPDGWRASLPKREVLPHYPMILHRGGFPDGS